MRMATVKGWREVVWTAGYRPLANDDEIVHVEGIFSTREAAQEWCDEENKKFMEDGETEPVSTVFGPFAVDNPGEEVLV